MRETLRPLAIDRGRVRLRGFAAGPPEGKPVILLHGFPDFWYGWRKQIPALAAAGFHVLAPDQRGYNSSSKPAGRRAYEIAELMADVLAVAASTGHKRVSLVGHDWGGAVAWATAARHPDAVERLAVLNIPHPAVMLRHLGTDPRQMIRSWYMMYFQLPVLPDLTVSRTAAAALRRSSRPGTFTDLDLERYREAWQQPRAMPSMINWYRALRPAQPTAGRVTVPTRILWGAQDAFLRREMAWESLEWCDTADLHEFADATHWLHLEEPARVNELLIEFLTR